MGLSPSQPTMIGLDPESSLCTTGHPANVLTGIFVRILREHFSMADNLEYEGSNEFESDQSMLPKRQLQQYVWTADNTTTHIQIQSVWDYNSQDIQRRPGLYVKRNGLQPQKLGIGDGYTMNAGRDANGKVTNVQGEYKSVLMVGSHTVFCVGNSGAEVELLGAEVFEHLQGFAQLIRQDVKLHRFAVLDLHEVALLDEFDEHYVVPIVTGYAFTWTWRVDKIAPRLKAVTIDVRP